MWQTLGCLFSKMYLLYRNYLKYLLDCYKYMKTDSVWMCFLHLCLWQTKAYDRSWYCLSIAFGSHSCATLSAGKETRQWQARSWNWSWNTKHGLKWKLTSLSTSRAFEHLPKLHSFVVRWRRSSLLWPRKFSNFRCYNFWKFVIFVLHGQYVYQMKAGNILHSNLT